MKKSLMNIIVCPLCRTELSLEIFEEVEEEVIHGTLTCSKCTMKYPIEDSIPNMLPQSLR